MKHYKPTTPSLRHKISQDRDFNYKDKKVKNLTVGLKKSAGRNHSGKITIRHRGGGHKKSYRLIDFKRHNSPVKIMSIQYDPNRTCNIALTKDINGKLSYILAANNVKVGDELRSWNIASHQEISQVDSIRDGNFLPIGLMPIGTFIHNLEGSEGSGGKYIRSAGNYGVIMSQDSRTGYTLIKMPSSELRHYRKECRAAVGQLSRVQHNLEVKGKAGVNRWLGIRPTVRGVAMNPIDHPHGGGEGKSSGGRPSVSPWGRLTKGKPTRKVRKSSKLIMTRRKK